MKVLYLISGKDGGGAKTHVLTMLRELNKDYPAGLAALGSGVLSEEALAMGLPTEILPEGLRPAMAALKEKLRREHWDLLHCHGSRANLIGALLRSSVGVPVISTVHSDPALDYMGRPLAGLVYGGLNRFSLRKMTALVCVSDAIRELMAERGLPPARLYSVYNGVDFSRPLSRPENGAWLRAHGCGFEPGDIVVGCAARLNPVKNLSMLLRGFAGAQRLCPALRLVIAGAGPEEPSLRSLARELGLSERVSFPGWIGDMDGFLGSLSVNVLTSRSESFPYVLVDGARYALPTAATAVGGVPRLIENGVTGLLIPSGDEAALTEALVRLARDPALRDRLGQALRRRAEERFSSRAAAKRQTEIYEDILKQSR